MAYIDRYYKMDTNNLFNDLEKIVDLGDPIQVQLYTDIISDENNETKLQKTYQLLYQILKTICNGTAHLDTIQSNPNPNQSASTQNQWEEITRLLAHLQHFVSILESFSMNSEYMNLFIENKIILLFLFKQKIIIFDENVFFLYFN